MVSRKTIFFVKTNFIIILWAIRFEERLVFYFEIGEILGNFFPMTIPFGPLRTDSKIRANTCNSFLFWDTVHCTLHRAFAFKNMSNTSNKSFYNTTSTNIEIFIFCIFMYPGKIYPM